MTLTDHFRRNDDGDLRVGDRIELTVGRPAQGGSCVARYGETAKVVFVEGAIEGEQVIAEITRAKAGESFLRAKTREVLTPSPARRRHPWPLADPISGRIGGAELGHMDPAEQRRVKAVTANDALIRLGRFYEEQLRAEGLLPEAAEAVEIPSGSEGARTRVAYAVTRDGRLGMYPSGGYVPVPVDDMPLAIDRLRAPGLFRIDYSGYERVEMAADDEAVLVLLVPHALRRPVRGRRGRDERSRPQASPRTLTDRDKRDLARSIAVALSPAGEGADAPPVSVAEWDPESQRLTPILGAPVLYQSVESAPGVHRSFRVTGDGFWQIHEGAPGTLSRAAVDMLDPQPGERLADLYAGAGLFTGVIADRVLEAGGPAQTLASVEAYAATSADAAVNFEDMPWVNVVRGTVERALAGHRFDRVLLDPSRAGAQAAGIESIVETAPQRIVYVSCDPGSFARDAALLRERGYRLAERKLYDIYPDTNHVETIARFESEAKG